MRATTLFLQLVVSFLVSHAISAPGTPILDEELFQSIRLHYNGAWDRAGGQSITQISNQNDGTLLIQFRERMAETAFYYLTSASEDIQYIPSYNRGFWSNYFDRIGNNIRCRLYSDDLKLDPFRDFRCSMIIDAQGNISVPAANNIIGAWEQPQSESFVTSVADDWNYSSGERYHLGDFSYDVSSDVAKIIYERLSVEAQVEYIYYGGLFPPTELHIKYGQKVKCTKIQTTQPNVYEYECSIIFDPHGQAFNTSAPMGSR